MIGSLIVVLSALLLSVSAQNPPIINPSSGRPPVITGISGCTAQSTTRTVNCHRPATLTLNGSGFMTGLEYEPNVSWQLMVSLYASSDDPNPLWCTFKSAVDTSLVCEVPSYGFGKIPPNQLYAVELMNWSTHNTSTLNDAVSFVPETSPRVDRVRGCSQISPDGRSASQCDVARDQITLVGSGFRNVDGQLATLSLGSASNLFQLIVDNKFLIRIDEDEIVFNFGSSNAFLPAIGAQSGQPLSLKLADWDVNGLWETEPVYLSFLPLPNPVVTSISAPAWAQGCVTDNSTTPTRFSNCVSGLSLLAVEGSYLFQPITISVNGIQCRVQSIGQTAVYFYMPIFDSVEGVYYDVTVATLAGSVTIPSIIEFNHDPLIYDVVPCIDMGITSAYSLVTAHCMAGQTLTLKVLHVASSTPRVFFRPSLANNSSAVMECPGVSRVDSRTITCTTPPMGDIATWGAFPAVYMWLEWQDGTKSAPISVAPLWDPSNAPRMTALSGCDSSSGNPLHLDKCLGSTSATLTIHGVRFSQPLTNGMAWTVVINNAVICDRPTVVNDETLTCILPNLALQEGTFGGLLYNEKYNIFVQGIAEYTLRTNAGYITFTIDQPSSSSSSSASASTIALATVFSIVGALLIGACLFYLLHSARVNKQRAALQSPEFSSTGQHVELEEV